MTRARIARLALLAVFVCLLASRAALAGAVILDLRSDPEGSTASNPVLIVEGPGASAVDFEEGAAPAFSSDRHGALRATYDAAHPSTRAVATLGELYTEQDDFIFGAVLTLRSETFHADPFGFHPITLSLVNQATTGFNRTGNFTDFRSDTFDTVEVAYFPQVSPLFGGPFLSPSVFGEAAGDDAFANFAFGSSQFEIPLDSPVAIVAEHLAAERKLVVTVHSIGADGKPVEIPGAHTEASLAFLSGFTVNGLAITAYEDGFNIFAPSGLSVHAEADYERLLFVPGRLGAPGSDLSLAMLLRVAGEGARGLRAR